MKNGHNHSLSGAKGHLVIPDCVLAPGQGLGALRTVFSMGTDQDSPLGSERCRDGGV
jgi:hypothetical protein